ncbi:MAG: MFS transporter [Alphaproteobacteria bacterium]|nr:MFS transporter [Alphaproteobacteria bacterium]
MSQASATGAVVSRRMLVPFAAMSASYFAHIGFFNPYLSLWLKELGYSVGVIGVLVSLQAFTRLYSPYAWGWLSDRTGHRVRLLQISAGIALLCSFGLAHQGGLWWLAVVLLLMFTHTSSMMPMSEAAMAHLVSQGGALDARRYGRIRLWGSLGFLVTVFLAGWWFDHHGMKDFPVWTWATLVLVNVSVWSMPNAREHHPEHQTQQSIAAELKRPYNRWFFFTLFFHVLAHIALYSFYSLYLDSLGYSKAVIGALWALSVAVEVLGFLTQGRWLHLLSLQRWVLICAVVLVFRMSLIAAGAEQLWVLALAQVLHTVTFAIHHSVCISWLSMHFPARLRGRGQALYSIVGYGATGFLGALGGGVLSEHFGLQSVFWLAIPVAACAVLGASQLLRVDVPTQRS